MESELFPISSTEEYHAVLACWKSPYVYQLSVMSCTTLTIFLSHRNTLWIELGPTDIFWELLKKFSGDVISCMNGKQVQKQAVLKEQIIQLNATRFHSELKEVQFGTCSFFKQITCPDRA
jgi:hypothetical protein